MYIDGVPFKHHDPEFTPKSKRRVKPLAAQVRDGTVARLLFGLSVRAFVCRVCKRKDFSKLGCEPQECL